MSSYIIAGSADSVDTAYCQQIARRIKAKYKNLDFRIVIKHPSQWQQYLQQICRIYGFLNKSNPIVYTFDGKIIGNKDSFISNASKYFGLDEMSLLVPNVTNKINMKQAQQQLNKKKIIKNNIKTMIQKIQNTYQNLLKKKILKYQLQPKQQYLVNGIQYYYRQITGLCPDMAFIKDKKIQIVVQQIKPQEIDLMALSLHDQIKPQDTLIKQAFVTTNQPQKIDQRMSQASKTNKLHQSMLSYDKDSKGMKQSNSKNKLRIDQQFDDVSDYIDKDMKQQVICQLGDNFYLSFQKNTYIKGQMVIYLNQDPNGNVIRVYNDGRPVKGHRVLTHPQNQTDRNNNTNILEPQFEQKKQEQIQQLKDQQQNNETPTGQNQNKLNQISSKNVQSQQYVSSKSKTDPNIQQKKQEEQAHLDMLSESPSELNLPSNLNYHTLHIVRPLSFLQLKILLNLLKQTDCISCLQFLPQNPNPKLKIYSRYFLLEDKNNTKLPIERFIQKQIQQNQYQILSVGLKYIENNQHQVNVYKINSLAFQHYYYPHNYTQLNEQLLSKVIKYVINDLLSLQEKFRREIGYHLIITKKYTIFIPIVQAYRVYNNRQLHLDGLAYLGLIHLAKVVEPFKNDKKQIVNRGQLIKSLLTKCSGLSEQ